MSGPTSQSGHSTVRKRFLEVLREEVLNTESYSTSAPDKENYQLRSHAMLRCTNTHIPFGSYVYSGSMPRSLLHTQHCIPISASDSQRSYPFVIPARLPMFQLINSKI